MTLGLTSVIVPTHQHAAYVCEAIDSALAQTAPVEVLVVDDCSTDETPLLLERRYRGNTRVKVLRRLKQGGPSVARNAGLEETSGEFVMFLDADDLIAPTKVADQLEAMAPEIGWVLCDVRIEDESKARVINASLQYRYDDKEIGGWIQPLLKDGNFIPIMSPLVRRSVLDGIRFDDAKVPEDWHFWHAVAGVARVRYVPKVLATYRHRRTGRSRLPKKARVVTPNVEQPLRLNLGCGVPTTRSWHPMPGLVNLDKSLGWCFEDGLGDFIDHSVAGITISHALMYVPESHWPAIFSEFARVLVPDGVVRITEDVTDDPKSARYGGWKGSEPAVTLTSSKMVASYLERAGFQVHVVDKASTRYRDRSLCQAQHGDPPNVFFIEGVKLRGVLFAPHNDDEALFAAFTVLKFRPHVVVCCPSTGDYGASETREAETREAMTVLGAAGVEQWPGGMLTTRMRELDATMAPVRVWAPDPQSSHPDHVAVALAAREVFGSRVTTYHTYVNGEKVRSQHAVPYEPGWIHKKLRALLRYESQLTHPRACAFFANDLHEFYGENP